MKRLITIISLLALVSGCNSIGGAVAVVNPLNFTTTEIGRASCRERV